MLDELFGYLDQLKVVDLTKQIEKLKSRNMDEELKIQRQLKKQLEKANSEFSGLKEEVMKIVMGQSSLNRDIVSKMMSEKEIEILELQVKSEKVQQELHTRKVEHFEMESLQNYIPIWRDVFDNASTEKKKMMLNTIIGSVTVYLDRLEVDLKLHINQFIDLMGDATTKEVYTNGKKNISKILSHSSLTVLA